MEPSLFRLAPSRGNDRPLNTLCVPFWTIARCHIVIGDTLLTPGANGGIVQEFVQALFLLCTLSWWATIGDWYCDITINIGGCNLGPLVWIVNQDCHERWPLRISSGDYHWWLSLEVVMCKRDCNGDWYRPWRVVIEECNLVFLGTGGGNWGMPFRITIEIAMVRDPAQLLSPKKVCSQKSTIKWTQTKIENTHADMARWCRQSPTHPYHPLHPLHPRYC